MANLPEGHRAGQQYIYLAARSFMSACVSVSYHPSDRSFTRTVDALSVVTYPSALQYYLDDVAMSRFVIVRYFAKARLQVAKEACVILITRTAPMPEGD